MKVIHRRYQSKLKGKGRYRVPTHACLMDKIDDCITEAVNEFNVSRSFVIAVALADFFGIKEQEQYREKRRKAS